MSSRTHFSQDASVYSSTSMSAAMALGFAVDVSSRDLTLEGSMEDLWIERICVFQTISWKGKQQIQMRSYYRNSRTGHVFESPPRGATNILPASEEDRDQARREQKSAQRALEVAALSGRSRMLGRFTSLIRNKSRAETVNEAEAMDDAFLHEDAPGVFFDLSDSQ